jgi:hypothetical protein
MNIDGYNLASCDENDTEKVVRDDKEKTVRDKIKECIGDSEFSHRNLCAGKQGAYYNTIEPGTDQGAGYKTCMRNSGCTGYEYLKND